jgi:hypothetical protein
MVVHPRHFRKAARAVPRHNHCRAKKPANKLKKLFKYFDRRVLASQAWEIRAEELSTMGTKIGSVTIADLQSLTRCWNQKTILFPSAARILRQIMKGEFYLNFI